MPTARKTKSGKWTILAHVGDATKSGYKRFTADTKKQAEILAAQFVERGKSRESVTVSEAIDNYIKLRENILSPATVRNYRGIQKNNLQTIMNINVFDLTAEQMQQAVNEESAIHAQKTVRCAHGLVYTAVKECRPDLVLRTKFPQKKKVETIIPTKAEVDELVSCATGHLRLAILLASQMGMRRSEILALKREDYKDGKISISKALVYGADGKPISKQPKTYSGNRVLTATEDVRKELEAQMPDAGERFVPLSPVNISMRFNRLLKAHPSIQHFRFHDLRHYYASVLLALNIPSKYAMQRMGHATDHMLKTVYQHTMKDRDSTIDEDISAYFSEKYNSKYNSNK